MNQRHSPGHPSVVAILTLAGMGTRPSYAEHPQTLTIAAANSLKDSLRRHSAIV